METKIEDTLIIRFISFSHAKYINGDLNFLGKLWSLD